MNCYENAHRAQPVVCRFLKKDAKLRKNPRCPRNTPTGGDALSVEPIRGKMLIKRNLCASHDVFGGIEVARFDRKNTKNRNSLYNENYLIKFTPNLSKVTCTVLKTLKTVSPYYMLPPSHT